MTIKQQGGVFGRNPTFNDVEIDGTLTLGGSVVPDPTNIAKLDAENVFTKTQTVSGTTSIDSIWTGASSAGAGGALRAIQNDGAALANGDRIGYLAYGGSYDGAGNLGFNAVINAYASENWTASARGTDVIIQTTNNGTAARNNRLIVRNDGTVEISRNLKITVAGYGIDFSATSGTGTSELFDDYEEGTWTPALEFTTSGSVTYNVQNGYYTKVGNAVHVQAWIYGSTLSSPTGDVRIIGMPFSADVSSSPRYSTAIPTNRVTGGTGITGMVYGWHTNATRLQLSITHDGATTANLTGDKLNTNFEFYVNYSYRAS